MLSDGFQWIDRWQYAHGELALILDGAHVAHLVQRINGEWIARLDVHKPITARLVTRACTDRDTGKAGIEAWACRHEARLRVEVAAGTPPRRP